MVKKSYIPNARDIVWIDCDPQRGHEEAGRRPALVISPGYYNKKTRLVVMVPITSRVKGYAFEVSINAKKTKGVILADQVRSYDWEARNAVFIEKAPEEILRKVREKIITLIQGM